MGNHSAKSGRTAEPPISEESVVESELQDSLDVKSDKSGAKQDAVCPAAESEQTVALDKVSPIKSVVKAGAGDSKVNGEMEPRDVDSKASENADIKPDGTVFLEPLAIEKVSPTKNAVKEDAGDGASKANGEIHVGSEASENADTKSDETIALELLVAQKVSPIKSVVKEGAGDSKANGEMEPRDVDSEASENADIKSEGAIALESLVVDKILPTKSAVKEAVGDGDSKANGEIHVGPEAAGKADSESDEIVTLQSLISEPVAPIESAVKEGAGKLELQDIDSKASENADIESEGTITLEPLVTQKVSPTMSAIKEGAGDSKANGEMEPRDIDSKASENADIQSEGTITLEPLVTEKVSPIKSAVKEDACVPEATANPDSAETASSSAQTNLPPLSPALDQPQPNALSDPSLPSRLVSAGVVLLTRRHALCRACCVSFSLTETLAHVAGRRHARSPHLSELWTALSAAHRATGSLDFVSAEQLACTPCGVRAFGRRSIADHLLGRRHADSLFRVLARKAGPGRRRDNAGDVHYFSRDYLFCATCDRSMFCASRDQIVSHIRGRLHGGRPLGPEGPTGSVQALWRKIDGAFGGVGFDGALRFGWRARHRCDLCGVSVATSRANVLEHVLSAEHRAAFARFLRAE